MSPSPSAPTSPSPSEPTALPNLPVSLQQSSSAGESRPGSGLRIAGIGTAAVGVVAIVTAVVLNVKANSLATDVERNYSSGTDSTRKDYTTTAWVGYAAGGACVVGGAVLYYLGVRQGRSLSVAPVVMANAAGVVLAGGFQ